MAEPKEFYERVAQTIIEKLKQGTAPWQKGWDGGAYGSKPINPTTSKRYRGGNALFLMMQGYDDPRWMTYRQAAMQDAQVKKGEHGTPIVYWKFEEEHPVKDEQGKPIKDEDGKTKMKKVQLERPRAFLSYVFNAQQIEGLPPLVQNTDNQWNISERAEPILANSGAKIEHKEQGKAFYRPTTDSITLPVKGQFFSDEKYYSTALHELGHWTGHESRLNRDLAHPFNSEGYAREELRAEIASFMLGQELGSYTPDTDQHVAYVASWIKALEEDPREIFRAAADAEKILDYVMAFELKQEQQVTQDTTQAEKMETKITEPIIAHEVGVSAIQQNRGDRLGENSDHTETLSGVQTVSTDLRDGEKPETGRKNTEKGHNSAKKRIYLTVSYFEREAAKEAGAKWDSVVRSWYVGDNADMQKLSQWLPSQQSEQAPAMLPREEFAEVLRTLGCKVEGEHPIMDGHTHRIPTEGDSRGALSGFYVAHQDGHPAGYAKNNRSGEETRWKSQGAFLSTKEKAILAAECVKNREERVQQLAQKQEKAALRVLYQLGDMQQASQKTPYQETKGLALQKGVFVGTDGKTTCLPAQDALGKIWTMQYIQEDGTKRFAKDARKEGCFHCVGGMDALAKTPVLVISEGYATASTLATALGHGVIAAFDAGNLGAVAKALHEKYPEKPIVIAGDDDRHLMASSIGKNPGREKAELAAQSVGGVAVFPIFATDEKGREFKDFNDLTKSKLGNDAVARQVRPAIEKAIRQHKASLAQDQQQTHKISR